MKLTFEQTKKLVAVLRCYKDTTCPYTDDETEIDELIYTVSQCLRDTESED